MTCFEQNTRVKPFFSTADNGKIRLTIFFRITLLVVKPPFGKPRPGKTGKQHQAQHKKQAG
ncbi:MAG TPA: hypothetical protein DCK76_08510 [Desulfotomaculum sp.]|nr:hypothetical protein [Desulfotomaculum sp.]HBY05170.1 hypothetical protein [Desulfotomaculum sp.]